MKKILISLRLPLELKVYTNNTISLSLVYLWRYENSLLILDTSEIFQFRQTAMTSTILKILTSSQQFHCLHEAQMEKKKKEKL